MDAYEIADSQNARTNADVAAAAEQPREPTAEAPSTPLSQNTRAHDAQHPETKDDVCLDQTAHTAENQNDEETDQNSTTAAGIPEGGVADAEPPQLPPAAPTDVPEDRSVTVSDGDADTAAEPCGKTAEAEPVDSCERGSADDSNASSLAHPPEIDNTCVQESVATDAEEAPASGAEAVAAAETAATSDAVREPSTTAQSLPSPPCRELEGPLAEAESAAPVSEAVAAEVPAEHTRGSTSSATEAGTPSPPPLVAADEAMKPSTDRKRSRSVSVKEGPEQPSHTPLHESA